MSRGSKEKGASYERNICQRLALWVTNGARTDVFWRSAMSGGRATLAARRQDGKKFDAQSGDISAIHPTGALLLEHFVIDSKHYKDFNTGGLIFGHTGDIIPMWLKLVEEANTAKKKPMLICKQNFKPEIVVLDEGGYDFMQHGVTNPYSFSPHMRLDPHKMWVFPLVTMFIEVDFSAIRKYYESPSNL